MPGLVEHLHIRKKYSQDEFIPVFRIRRMRKFLELPDPDSLVGGTDPDPPFIKHKNNKKALEFYCVVSS